MANCFFQTYSSRRLAALALCLDDGIELGQVLHESCDLFFKTAVQDFQRKNAVSSPMRLYDLGSFSVKFCMFIQKLDKHRLFAKMCLSLAVEPLSKTTIVIHAYLAGYRFYMDTPSR